MKIILLLLALLAIYWFFWGRRKVPPPRRDAPAAKAETMVVCALCGVHVPRGEATEAAGRYYCCDEHRQRDNR